MSYPKIIKEAALEKMFHTDLSLRHIADELGIPRATLHGWKRQYQMIKNDSEAIAIPAESWTPVKTHQCAPVMPRNRNRSKFITRLRWANSASTFFLSFLDCRYSWVSQISLATSRDAS